MAVRGPTSKTPRSLLAWFGSVRFSGRPTFICVCIYDAATNAGTLDLANAESEAEISFY